MELLGDNLAELRRLKQVKEGIEVRERTCWGRREGKISFCPHPFFLCCFFVSSFSPLPSSFQIPGAIFNDNNAKIRNPND